MATSALSAGPHLSEGVHDRLVRTFGGRSTVPGLAVRISATGECIGEGQVDTPSLRVRGSLVDRRADQRVTHAHGGRVGDQEAGPQGALEGIVGAPELRCGTSDHQQLAGVLCGRHEQPRLNLRWKRATPVEEGPLDPLGEVQLRRERGGALELRGGQLGRKLQERQRVAARLGDQSVDDVRARSISQAIFQEGARRLGAEPAQDDLLRTFGPERPPGTLTGRERHEDAIGIDPSRAEQQ